MEQFATFLFKATHGRNSEFYLHTSAEVYFNKVVAIVEEKAKAILGQDPFSDNWQSKKCEELVRAFVTRKIRDGIEEAFRMSCGRKSTSSISCALFMENSLDSIESRASIVTEFKCVGRFIICYCC